MFKAIDLHIHTKRSVSDNMDIDFDMSRLRRYVKDINLKAIAITNHNLFDRKQYEEITEAIIDLDTVVFPGVEIDLEGGHILVIAPQSEVDQFEKECKSVETLVTGDQNFSLSCQEFNNIFQNKGNYLLIPHYDKKPKLADSVIDKIGGILAGEVQSPKKFIGMKKNKHKLTPVIFSDMRIGRLTKDDVPPSPKITYVKIDQISISNLKIALKRRENVSLSNKGSDEFTIDSVGTQASLGLNVVLGKRSSGKTHLLKSLFAAYGDDDTLYIRQFEITQQCQEDDFDELINNQYQQKVDSYLRPLKEITKIVTELLDEREIANRIEVYLSGLKKFASEQAMKDEYAKAKLYSETPYDDVGDSVGSKFLESLLYIIEHADYNSKVQSNIALLKELYVDAFNDYRYRKLRTALKKEADAIISAIKSHLAEKSALKPVPQINLCEITKTLVIYKRYDALVKNAQCVGSINELNEKYGKFNIVAEKAPFSSPNDIRTYLSTQSAIKNHFDKYYRSSPHSFVRSVYADTNIKEDPYKMLVKITVSPRKKDGSAISGGERAEYVLLKKLSDAHTYKLLLFDEPEPSFDNPFISEYVIDKLKELSQNITVFVSTHNNTLGVSMDPDMIIYASEENGTHYLYTGNLTNRSLFTADQNKELELRKTLLDALEAGEFKYNERKDIYEHLKSK